MTALFHSDIELLMDSLQHDFGDVVKVSSIGKSFEGRPIKVMEVNGRDTMIARMRDSTPKAGADF